MGGNQLTPQQSAKGGGLIPFFSPKKRLPVSSLEEKGSEETFYVKP